MPSYREPRRKDWVKSLFYIAIYIAVLGFSSFYLLLSYWFVWAMLVIGGLLILLYWHARNTGYHCQKCGCEFEISMLTDFLSHHGVDKEGAWMYLNCPKCSTRSRMRILLKSTYKDAS